MYSVNINAVLWPERFAVSHFHLRHSFFEILQRAIQLQSYPCIIKQPLISSYKLLSTKLFHNQKSLRVLLLRQAFATFLQSSIGLLCNCIQLYFYNHCMSTKGLYFFKYNPLVMFSLYNPTSYIPSIEYPLVVETYLLSNRLLNSLNVISYPAFS